MAKARRRRAGTATSKDFERALEAFRGDVEPSAQFFYGYIAVHALAGRHDAVYRLLNTAPLFWNTSLGALQTATFVALGRVFDRKTQNDLCSLLDLAENNRRLFSKSALRSRRHADDPRGEWLDDFMRHAHEPTAADFRRLRKAADRWCAVYDQRYRILRNKVFAHTVVTDESEVHAMMAKTKVREVERMLGFLLSLHEALLDLLHNGRRPVLRRRGYSLKQMLARPWSYRGGGPHERVVMEARRFLRRSAGARR
jgi:AbiU2